MSKKIVPVLVGIFLFLGCRIVQADIVINEFVSHPNTGESEWVELLNTGNSSQDLSGWKLTELTSPSTNPKEENLLNLSGILLAGKVIVFDVKNLNDTGDSISLYKGTEFIDNVTYGKVLNKTSNIAAPLVGLSGALVFGSWKTNQNSTKGENQVLENENIENEEETTIETETTKTPSVNKTKIVTENPAFVGLPVEFKIDNSISEDFCGMYLLNFGDGSSVETKKVSHIQQNFSHIYYYEGEYIVTLECYKSYFSSEPISVNKITMKVVEPAIFISKVGNEKDFFVEISNNTSFEIDLSNWALSSYLNKFIFSKNSILKAKSKIIISPKITGFSILDKSTLKLLDSEGKIKSTLSSAKPATISTKKSSTSNMVSDSTEKQKFVENSGIKNTDNVDEESGSIYGIILFVFLGISAIGTYFIRNRNRKISSVVPGGDFEIIDE